MMHIKLWVLLLSMSLLTACSKDEAGTEAPGEPTKEICFSLNAGDAIGLSPARAAASIDGMSWKLLCFSDEYQYLFEATGTVSACTPPVVAMRQRLRKVCFRYVSHCSMSTRPERTAQARYSTGGR